jgi:nicotinate-nucleotide adenylyltransferase
MKRFDLTHVWWLVSPGNPLKQHGPAPMQDRMAYARRLMAHPRVVVSDIEAHLGTRYTAETLAAILSRHQSGQFVWLMGADNLAQLHLWQDWQWIMETVPVGVLARPGERISARMSPAARLYAQHRLSGQASHLLGRATAPAWSFVNVPMIAQSSSAIRARGEWTCSAKK